MMSMDDHDDYLQSGRRNQKQRTRQALIEAAMELLREGADPSVAEAADRARVSRTTAYRYFDTQEALLAQAAVAGAMRSQLELIRKEANGPGEADQRVDAVVRADHRATLLVEPLLRAVLRTSLTPAAGRDVPRRPGYRVSWFRDALAPLAARLGAQSSGRLMAALSLCVGIESLVVLQDLCGLGQTQAEEVKRWAAAALVQAACAEARRAAPPSAATSVAPARPSRARSARAPRAR
jgi:AcrR family transcriptional regulator